MMTNTTNKADGISFWLRIGLFAVLICGICLYAALRLIKKARTSYPLNYILLILVVILICVGMAFCYTSQFGLSVSVAVTFVVSFITISTCWKLNSLTINGLIVFISLACVLCVVGLTLLILEIILHTHQTLLATLSGIILCWAATAILICVGTH
uniref:Uncharacterized protein n=1 Tax=Trichobilharzia regenti TaxID=157069 RepID=A0AA85J151_TRIRE|nr:unnamed protein product [Trichobilharzia regenti]